MRMDHPTNDPERAAEGWNPQFMIEAERAHEYIELYESLGNEVRVEALDTKRMQDDECAACLMAACDRYVMIYTRPKNAEVKS